MADRWDDLSDDELAARLAERAPDTTDVTATDIARLVQHRDDDQVAAIITRVLEG